METQASLLNISCPVPQSKSDRVLLGHGSGGRMTTELLDQVFLPSFSNDILNRMEDQATVPFPPAGDFSTRLAFTTDAFVVRPIFFPGGDIGKLAVHGTLNDLAVGGARPLYLSAAFIIEEGLEMSDLKRIVLSMREACLESGVQLVTGDTKVVDHGKGDKIFITTSGIGVVPNGINLSCANAKAGDVVIVSGTIGDHGMAIMSVREGLEFNTVLQSDSASLFPLTAVLLEECPGIRCMRDPTRGGVAATLQEISEASNVGIKIIEAELPVKPEVKAACEMLGFDPLYVANEGKLIAIVPSEEAERALAVMKLHPLGRDAAVIGRVVDEHREMVTVRTSIGGERVMAIHSGEQLPRIC
jgi:hydrogenase expression/formation protein HypE